MAKAKVFKDMRSECECESCEYCPLEAMLGSQRDYILEQHKLVEYFKFIQSEAAGKDIGWQEAYLLWNDLGYAKRYNDIYTEEKSYKQMRSELFK